MRLRRLQADYEKLDEFARRHPRLRLLQAQGNPPELYQLEYQITGLRQTDDELHLVRSHIVEIALPRNYPRTPPQCRMLTPIFHPNIAPHAICIGDHWAAGEPLWSMVARIGEMIAYQSYNTKSPLNGEAARWVDSSLDRLPLDSVSMMIDEPEQPPAPPRQTPAQKPTQTPPARSQSRAAKPTGKSAKPLQLVCPKCQARYRFSVESAGKRARCKQCQTIFTIPTP